MLPRLTHVEATHEAKSPVHHEQLFVMSPEQHHAVRGAVQGLDGIARRLCQVKVGEMIP